MDYTKLIKQRLQFMGAVSVVASLLLLGRLFDVQIIQHDRYLALAQDQQRFEKIELAERGRILVHDSFSASDYYPLAFDVRKFAVWVVPHNIKDKVQVSRQLAQLLALPEESLFKQLNNDKLYVPPVKRGLTLDQANGVKSQKLPGVLVVPEYSRFYPENNLAAHVLGFVNSEGMGNYGFEGHYDNELRGLAGNMIGEKDTLGRVINLIDQHSPQDGVSYVLTLNRSVQYVVEKKLQEAIEEFEADSGSVIVMDVQTGGIVAMANSPSFDPNNFRQQAADDASTFINPSIAHLYEPGSVFKPIIMAAALDRGVISPQTEGVFGSSVTVDGYEIHTAEGKAFGRENMAEVLQNSDNVAMVWLSEKLGSEAMYSYIKDFNMLAKTGIDLDSEIAGTAPELKRWRDINRATISFGQGIAVTPIELVAAYNAIANDGVYLYPHLVEKIIYPDGKEKEIKKDQGKRIIKEQSARDLTEMLVQTVDRGHAWRAGVPGFSIAAKTGTAQIAQAEGGYEDSEDKLGIFNHTLAGFGPADSPRYAMVVKLERPRTTKYAENTAGALFGEISSFLLNYYYRAEPTKGIEPLRFGGN